MQRTTPATTTLHSNQPNVILSRFAKLTVAIITVSTLSLTGCQTVKGVFGDKEETVITASKTDEQYYQDAVEAMDKQQYVYASEQLAELRTFYPTGPFAEQALLDLMYSQFNSNEYELAASSAEKFIKLYPNNMQVDYAYYVRGVSNMQANSSTILNLARLQQAHRDTSYLRLAFSNFQELIARFPNSAYAPDAAQRMTFIYNELAENELTAARWYIKRDAYVAAANRAKWVFQYYPLSQQTPEAIAILAYSHEQLGLTDLAKEYKTLLQINYPEWLTRDGRVKLNSKNSNQWLSTLTFGVLGRSDKGTPSADIPSDYSGQTKTQIIYQAAQLQLPKQNQVTSQDSLPSFDNSGSRNFNLGLGLPEEDAQQITNQTSTTNRPARITSPVTMYPNEDTIVDTQEDELGSPVSNQ